MVTDKVWKLPAIVDRYLSFRTAIPMMQEQVGVMLSILKSRPAPVQNFMDLGCGDGFLGAAVLGSYPSSRGVFVDFSRPMLDMAREHLRDAQGQLTFLDLDYGDPSWVKSVSPHLPFDTVVSGLSIHHQPDERKHSLYRDIYSLLSPGGWFINIEHIAPASQLNTDLFNNHVVDGYYAIEQRSGGKRTREEMADVFLKRPDKDANKLQSLEIQCGWLRELGYEQVDCYFRIYELAVFAGRRPSGD